MSEHLPWRHPDLEDWSIVGMNHYRLGGTRRLFVAMTKPPESPDDAAKCIQAEGPDTGMLWEELRHKARMAR